MSSKAAKAAALRKFQKDRNKERSALDDYNADETTEDVYQVMTEEEYTKVVESRRQRDDFIVDDDGLGYLDDGEEHVFDQDNDDDNHAKRTQQRSSTAALTQQALKQARKQQKAAGVLMASAEDETGTAANRSMWEFVNKAPSSAPAANTTSRSASTNKRSLDALLSELDHDEDMETTGSHGRSRTSGARARNTNKKRVTKSSRASMSSSRASTSRRQAEQDTTDFPMNNDDYDDDDNAGNVFEDDAEPMQVDHKDPTPSSTTTKSVHFADDAAKEQAAAKESINDETMAETNTTKAPRRVLARPKLNMSEPARLALERKQMAATSSTDAVMSMATAKGNSTLGYPEVVLPMELNMASSSSGPSASQVDLEKLVSKTTRSETHAEMGETIETEESFVDFFWMDLAERKNGDILLFGKVPLTPNSNNTKYISACALVTGNVRNLFALPRNPEAMLSVHQEINGLLHSSVLLPRKPGVSWAGKPVTRNYAFEDATLPREPTKYLKIVYDAKYPAPSEEMCQNGGEHFSKILNAGASLTETFILKRKLMGPCWIRISNPKAAQAPLSWCQAEMHVHSPKQIVRLDLVKDGTSGGPPRPPPPVVTMSLKLHTMVHPKTHQSEIVAVSAVCHKNVLLDSATSDQSIISPHDMAHITLIRPLPVVATSNNDDAAGHTVSSKPTMGTAQFPRDMDREIQANMPQLKRETNERALISRLLVQIGQWDPDVIVAHNAWGFEMEVLLSRCIEHKLKTAWSKVGRRRCSDLPNKSHFASRRDVVILDAMAGRLLCDTYLSAQENLRETTYSLTSLAATQLKCSRQAIEPADTPQWFESSKTIVQLAARTLVDAQLVQRLMFKLQTLPLTKQLTCVAGNIWSHTLKSNRAERTEYLLLHEFHRLKFLAPEKRRGGKKANDSNKAKYSGGLVLEPKKGLYDSYILLLDFNSLYPSIIQEYNLCFTTIDWSKFTVVVEEGQEAVKGELPPLPDSDEQRGVLPRVIKSLVDRRRAVKRFMKDEKDPEKKEELNIRQTALKLTANSMYGCLGFSNSRFYAQPIAALVTAMGRETLQRTVDIAQNTVGLDVIYGDTDSIMINTRLSGDGDLRQVRKLGEQVKQEVNKLYNTLELEIDGVFKPMLLLKKKKYAANTVEELPNGEIKYGQELKGLDLVRRDWCVQSRDTGRYVTEQILSGQDSELVFENIFAHLEEIAGKMRSGELPIEKYVITKGLSKHPTEYPDAKAQPHVQVAKMMLANNRAVNKGDHIPYIITAPLKQEGDDPNAKALPAAERARHPEEVARSEGVLKPDVEWYLTQQILPPISRLCEPIEACSPDILADKLGLDGKKYNQAHGLQGTIDDDAVVNFTPASFLPDKERFKDVTKLEIYCAACNEKSCISGVFDIISDGSTGAEALATGLRCVNPDCQRPALWGHGSHLDLFARIQNAMSVWERGLTMRYYQGVMQCSEPGCSLKTRQLSVAGGGCLRRGCTGRLQAVEKERNIHTHLKYLETLFDINHACEQLEDAKKFGRKVDLLKTIPSQDKVMFDELHSIAKDALGSCAFNWISSAFFTELFESKQ